MEALTNIRVSSTRISNTAKTIQQVFNEVVQILLKHLELEAAYCFGFQSEENLKHNILIDKTGQKEQHWQLSLLLIGTNFPPNATANLADIVSKQFKGEINLGLLCYSPKQIALSNNEHQHLFQKIIRSGWLIYGIPFEIAKLKLDNLPDLNYKGIIRYCENRLMISESLLSNATQFLDQPLTAAFLLRNSIEQLSLAILYSFIHYHPNQFHIFYLLQLCQSCCHHQEITWPIELFQDQRLKELLKTSASDLRFRSTDIFTKEDVQYLHHCCLSFKKKVEPLLQKQLLQLKSKSDEKEIEEEGEV
ncbi:hypothetical protein LZ575_11355 [Antarcticibacterium sp. 1MA-6-2]|uniref:hypothetical protein n=1 Tax=Antarcticibacterium sp. 1MA-6-2 TaxID=2908210 RepID=UPI001F3ACDF2|nr:hypothetical protein [Antarcticibacterium sp. 1MA-6-2]UJH89678.1 hypothetical protein LZ575_11355 [Antarcticibacterium sp. 1MA-6-2]